MEKQQPNRAANPNRRDAEVLGSVQECTEEYRTILAKPVNQIQVHNKAVRVLSHKMGKINMEAFNSLSIVATYLKLHNLKRANRDFIIDWSGATKNWKAKTERGLNKSIEEGSLIVCGDRGRSVELTEKGRLMIDDYDNIFEEAKRAYIDKARNKRKQATESRKG